MISGAKVRFYSETTKQKAKNFCFFLKNFCFSLFFVLFGAYTLLYILDTARHQDTGGRCADLSEHGQASRTAAEGVQLHEWHGQASRREAGGIFPPTRKAGREERPQLLSFNSQKPVD